MFNRDCTGKPRALDRIISGFQPLCTDYNEPRSGGRISGREVSVFSKGHYLRSVEIFAILCVFMIRVASFGERFGGCFRYLISAHPLLLSPLSLCNGILLLIPILSWIINQLDNFRKQSPVEQ